MVWKSVSPDYPSPPPPVSKKDAPKFCTKCGSSLRSDDRFCSKCGHEVVAVVSNRNACECKTIFGPKDRFCGVCGKNRPSSADPVVPSSRPPRVTSTPRSKSKK